MADYSVRGMTRLSAAKFQLSLILKVSSWRIKRCAYCTQRWGTQNNKNWFWTVSTLLKCGGRMWWCGDLERTDFEQFLLWEAVVVLKELILNTFYFGRLWWSWKNWFWTVSTLGGCGGLERTDFELFLLWEAVVVLNSGKICWVCVCVCVLMAKHSHAS